MNIKPFHIYIYIYIYIYIVEVEGRGISNSKSLVHMKTCRKTKIEKENKRSNKCSEKPADFNYFTFGKVIVVID